jgi:hypothetical protein
VVFHETRAQKSLEDIITVGISQPSLELSLDNHQLIHINGFVSIVAVKFMRVPSGIIVLLFSRQFIENLFVSGGLVGEEAIMVVLVSPLLVDITFEEELHIFDV